jgi:hypothetical protein
MQAAVVTFGASLSPLVDGHIGLLIATTILARGCAGRSAFWANFVIGNGG